jgi:hypothetical protein
MTEHDQTRVQPRTVEDLQVLGEQLVARVKELIHEGNVRRIIIKQEGRTLIEIPLAVGLVGGALSVLAAPTLAAIGAIGALVSRVSIEVVRSDEHPGNQPPTDFPQA